MNAVITLAILAPAAPPALEPAAPDVKVAVSTGLKWLAAQQKADGNWDGLNSAATTSVTAYAGLAFLMEGSTPSTGTYAPQIRKAMAWVEKNTGRDGRLASNSDVELFQYVVSHAHALLFLSCAYDADDDPDRRKRLAGLLKNAVAFTVECQSSRGGWGYTRPVRNTDYDDGISTANVLQALLAARKVGIDVPPAVIDKSRQYLVRGTNRDGGIIQSNFGGAVPRGNDGNPTISAIAAAGWLMADGPRPEQLGLWAHFGQRDALSQLPLVRTNPAGTLAYQFSAARVAYALGETGHRRLLPDAPDTSLVRWSTHRKTTYTALKNAQTKDGNWADPTFGPAYSTALALLILQLDNDYLPAFSR